MAIPPITKVKIDYEHFIPVPKFKVRNRLVQAIADEEDRNRFIDFCKILGAIYHFESHDTQEELKRDFILFNTDSTAAELEGLTNDEIERAEDQFLTNFFKLMEKGNFSPLTQDDYDIADAEDFLFNLPVKINLKKLDDELLPRFFSDRPELLQKYYQGELPEFARRIMIFRRGVDVETFTGFLLLQKVDILINRVLSWTFQLPGRIFRYFTQQSKDESAIVDVGETKKTSEAKQVIFDDRYIERIGPKHVTDGLFCLLRKDTIQEPTFAQLVILFRYATPEKRGRGHFAGNGPEGAAHKMYLSPFFRKDRVIHIKQFRDIPMADLEVIYPEKRLSLKPMDLLKLSMTGLAGIAVVAWKIVSAALNPVLLIVMLSTVIGYAMKVFAGWKASRDRYEQLVVNSLYHKSLDNDLGVIFYLMDSLESQEFKEAVLAYFFLWRDGPMKQDQLDAACERFIKDEFDAHVDFEVDDALDKLVADKLVIEKDGLYHAVPLQGALETLDQKWDNYFMYNNDREAESREGNVNDKTTHDSAQAMKS